MIDAKVAVLSRDFSSRDILGESVRLSDYRGKKNIVLVFNRGLG